MTMIMSSSTITTTKTTTSSNKATTSSPLHFIAVASLLLFASGTSSFQPQNPTSLGTNSHHVGRSSSSSSSSSRRNAFMPSFQGLVRKKSGTTTLTTTSTTIEEEVPMIPMDTSMTNNAKIPTALSPAQEEKLIALASAAALATATRTTTTRGGTSKRLQPVSTTSSTSWRNKRILRSLIPSKQMIPELIGECFGTFVLLQLVLGIVPAAVFCGTLPGGAFPIAILTGMGIPVACAAVSSKSAAHFNPAITWAMCLYRGFGWNKLMPYITAQLLGATAAAGMNYLLFASHLNKFEVANGLLRTSIEGGALQTAASFACYFEDPISTLTAMFAETWGTFILTSVIFALTSQRNTEVKGLYIPPLIGSVVALIICIIGPISSASLNPARELGPRLILKLAGWSSSVAFHQLPMYICSAFAGSTLGGLFVDHILYPGSERPRTLSSSSSSSSSQQDKQPQQEVEQHQKEADGILLDHWTTQRP